MGKNTRTVLFWAARPIVAEIAEVFIEHLSKEARIIALFLFTPPATSVSTILKHDYLFWLVKELNL